MTCTRTHRKRHVTAWAVLAAAMLFLSSAVLRAGCHAFARESTFSTVRAVGRVPTRSSREWKLPVTFPTVTLNSPPPVPCPGNAVVTLSERKRVEWVSPLPLLSVPHGALKQVSPLPPPVTLKACPTPAKPLRCSHGHDRPQPAMIRRPAYGFSRPDKHG